MNNEIRRLVRCIVEASAESNIQFEEIQAEIARQFGKEIRPQVYQDVEPKTFRQKVKIFLRNEIGHSYLCGKIENVIELLCIFYNLRQQTPREELVQVEKITEEFMQKCHISEGTARGYYTQAGGQIKSYLKEEKGIKLKNNVRINKVLEEAYPFIEQM